METLWAQTGTVPCETAHSEYIKACIADKYCSMQTSIVLGKYCATRPVILLALCQKSILLQDKYSATQYCTYCTRQVLWRVRLNQ